MHYVLGQYNSALASDTDRQARNDTDGLKGNCGVHGDISRQFFWSRYHSTRIKFQSTKCTVYCTVYCVLCELMENLVILYRAMQSTQIHQQ